MHESHLRKTTQVGTQDGEHRTTSIFVCFIFVVCQTFGADLFPIISCIAVRKSKETAVHWTYTGKLLALCDRCAQFSPAFLWSCSRVVVENDVPTDFWPLRISKPLLDGGKLIASERARGCGRRARGSVCDHDIRRCHGCWSTWHGFATGRATLLGPSRLRIRMHDALVMVVGIQIRACMCACARSRPLLPRLIEAATGRRRGHGERLPASRRAGPSQGACARTAGPAHTRARARA